MQIDHATLRTLSPAIQRACRDERFYALLEPWGCGAFDGGCVLVALALREVLGAGQCVILQGYSALPSQHPRRIGNHHALLHLGECYLDGDGAARRRTIVQRWRRSELLIVTGFVPVADFATLIAQGAVFDATVLRQLVAFFHAQLDGHLHSMNHPPGVAHSGSWTHKRNT